MASEKKVLSRLRQVKLYLSHETHTLLGQVAKRTGYSNSLCAEVLLRRHLRDFLDDPVIDPREIARAAHRDAKPKPRPAQAIPEPEKKGRKRGWSFFDTGY